MRFLVGLALVCLAFLNFLKTEKPPALPKERGILSVPAFEEPLPNSIRLGAYDPLAALLRAGTAWAYFHRSHKPAFRALSSWFWPLLAGQDPLIWEWDGPKFRLLAPVRGASGFLGRFSLEQQAVLEGGQVLSLSYGESSPLFCSQEQGEWLFCHNELVRPKILFPSEDSARNDLKLDLKQFGIQVERLRDGLHLKYAREDSTPLKPASLFSCEKESFCLQAHLPEALNGFFLEAYEGPQKRRLASALAALDGSVYLWGSYRGQSLKWLELGLEARSSGESARLVNEWLGILKQERIPFEVQEGSFVFSFPILPHKLELKREQERLKIRLGPVSRIQGDDGLGLGSLVLSIEDFRDLLLQRLKAFRFQKQKELERECESGKRRGALGFCPLGPGYVVEAGQVRCPLHQNPQRIGEIGDALFSHAEFFLHEIGWAKLHLKASLQDQIHGFFRIR